ncbi:MAG: hypothetical protein PQJ59_00435 [Spirochaetales bacterium]|nr:hypothetical protein [Spirochaetales bacterium]
MKKLPLSLLIHLLLFSLTGCQEKPIVIVLPDDFEGPLKIVEDKKNYDPYYGPAYENFKTYEFKVGMDNTLRVKNLGLFEKGMDQTFCYESVAPGPNISEVIKENRSIILIFE